MDLKVVEFFNKACFENIGKFDFQDVRFFFFKSCYEKTQKAL